MAKPVVCMTLIENMYGKTEKNVDIYYIWKYTNLNWKIRENFRTILKCRISELLSKQRNCKQVAPWKHRIINLLQLLSGKLREFFTGGSQNQFCLQNILSVYSEGCYAGKIGQKDIFTKFYSLLRGKCPIF